MVRLISRARFTGGAAAASAALACPATVRSQTSTLRVGATANDTYAQAYYAQDMGFFRDAGLTVELTTFANGGAVAQGVAGNALDIGITNPPQLAAAVAHGLDFVYIAGGGLYSSEAPTTLLCVAKDGPIHNAKDLDGKTIAASQVRDITAVSALAWLGQNGANAASVQLTEMPFAEMGAALARGTVFAATISEPSLTAAQRAGQVRPLGKLFDVIAPRFMIGGWFAHAQWVSRNRELAHRYAEVMYRTARWANANAERSAEILSKYSKVPLTTVRAMTRCRYAEALPDAIVAPPVELAFRAKLIDRAITAQQIIVRP